jgi:hypothetical protein
MVTIATRVSSAPSVPMMSSDPLIERIAGCAQKGVKGHCKNHPDEHPKYIMPVLCMQQQCPDCGQDNSKAHRRRWERWTGGIGAKINEKTGNLKKKFGKITQLSTMGYWTVELPERLRSDVTLSWSAKGLRNFRKRVLSVIAGTHGRKGLTGGVSERGLWSYHFFGDYYGLINGHVMNIDGLEGRKYLDDFKDLITTLSTLGCVSLVVNPNKPHTIYWHPEGDHLEDQSYMVTKFAKKYCFKIKGYSEIKWNPHLNVLTDGGHIEPDRLEVIKKAIRDAVGAEDVIVHYSYVSLPAQMVQKVKYIVRSTFLDLSWSPYMAHQLNRFINMGRWGNWNGPEKWSMSATIEADAKVESIAASLGNHECPECHGKWIWERKVESMTKAELEGASPIGNTGYYVIPVAVPWHGHHGVSPEDAKDLFTNEDGELTPDKALRLFFLRHCGEDAGSKVWHGGLGQVPNGEKDIFAFDEVMAERQYKENYNALHWRERPKRSCGSASILSDYAWAESLEQDATCDNEGHYESE